VRVEAPHGLSERTDRYGASMAYDPTIGNMVRFGGYDGSLPATKMKMSVPLGATTGTVMVVTPGGKAKTATAFTVP